MEVSDLSDKAPSPFEEVIPSLEQLTQTIQFGTLPEIFINVVYILLEEYQRQTEWANWSDEDLEEKFEKE